jgi:HlyD family secretion protein
MSEKTRKKRKVWIIWVVIAVLIAVAILVGLSLQARRRGSLLANVRSEKALVGTIEKTVSGTGNLSAKETTNDITVLDGLAIDQVLVETGDNIKTGDVLATFDAAALQTAVWDTQAKLNTLDSQINRVKSSTESQYIRTAVAGRIKLIFASAGDDIQSVMTRDGALLILSLDGHMKVAFKPASTAGITVGSTVAVKLSDGSTVDGAIQSISASQCVVTISDKTAPVDDLVSISMDGAELGSGKLEINQPMAITATEGRISEVRYQVNDLVGSGSILFKLEAAPVSQAYQKLYAQRLEQTQRLATLIRYAQSNALLATCSGEVLSVGITEGETTGASKVGATGSVSSDIAVHVRTASETQLLIKIDELDINALAVGQTASITLDALTGLTETGTISEIAQNGSVSQGNTTFTVTLALPVNDQMRLGMSATAVIMIEKRENIVKIPLSALQESGGEQYVYVGTAVSANDLGEKRVVVIGISDGEYVEIKSGLASGETVNYYYASGSSTVNPFRPGGGISQTSTTTGR